MAYPKKIACIGLLVSYGCLASYSVAVAQVGAGFQDGGTSVFQSDWDQRVLRRGGVGRPASYHRAGQVMLGADGSAAAPAVGAPAVPAPNVTSGQSAVNQPGLAVPEDGPPEPRAAAGVSVMPPGLDPDLDDGFACDGGCGDCETCRACCGPAACRQFWWLRGFSFFAGVEGFKGSPDQGRNGNFGFHEGVDFGGPLGGPLGLGYQIGFQAMHSDFEGNQVVENAPFDTGSRNQMFLSAGLFRRPGPCGGWQAAVVFDHLHDDYYVDADLKQLRAELSYVFHGNREFGYWGAYGLDNAQVDDGVHRVKVEPHDLHALFYRHHFCGGGEGRLWSGASSDGDAFLGADATVPLGASWALGSNFAYLIPSESDQAGQEEETWSLSIRLIWYPGRAAQCALQDPFRPVLPVADNSVFMIRRR